MNISIQDIVGVVKRTQQLEERLLQLERVVKDQEITIKQQNSELEKYKKTLVSFEEKLSLSEEEKRQESFYQRELEKYFGGKHVSCEHGVIDILTDDSLIEIKNWNKYKDSIGQILSYSLQYPNHKKIVVFFGQVKEKKRDSIIELFSKHNIEIKEAREEKGQVLIEDLFQNFEKDDFTKWLNEHIVYNEGSILKLSDVCCMYLNQDYIAPRKSHKYKHRIETFIKHEYPKDKHLYQDTFFNGIKYKGWLHFSLV